MVNIKFCYLQDKYCIVTNKCYILKNIFKESKMSYIDSIMLIHIIWTYKKPERNKSKVEKHNKIGHIHHNNNGMEQ